MNNSQRGRVLGAVAAMTVVLGGCAISPITVISSASPRSETATVPTKTEMVPVVMQLSVTPEQSDRQVAQTLTAAIQSQDGTAVFFDTGSAELSKDGKLKLLRIGEVLRANPNLKVRIEGNADERGTSEFNQLLAARRAVAARDFLVTVQVHPDQIAIASNGKDKPLAPGSGEEQWQLNRRSDVKLIDDKK